MPGGVQINRELKPLGGEFTAHAAAPSNSGIGTYASRAGIQTCHASTEERVSVRNSHHSLWRIGSALKAISVLLAAHFIFGQCLPSLSSCQRVSISLAAFGASWRSLLKKSASNSTRPWRAITRNLIDLLLDRTTFGLRGSR